MCISVCRSLHIRSDRRTGKEVQRAATVRAQNRPHPTARSNPSATGSPAMPSSVDTVISPAT